MRDRKLKNLEDLSKFAEDFLARYPDGNCVGLTGEVGGGKTTFVRACVEALCRRSHVKPPRVVSPSYTVQQSYPTLIPPVEHFDLYRSQSLDFKGLVEMGYYEALASCREKKGFVFVEWPERATASVLQLGATLHFEITGESSREIRYLPAEK